MTLPDRTLIQFVRRSGRIRGVMVAMKTQDGFAVGCSLCKKIDMPHNRFDKQHGIEIALGRIVVGDAAVPQSMIKDYQKFVDRCERYYRVIKQAV